MARRLRPTVAVLSLALAACAGETDEVDAEALAAAVPAALAPEAPETVTDVTCPEEVARGTGVVVVCTALLSGTEVEAEVEQLDDEGAVSVRTATVVLDAADLADDLAGRMAEDLGIAVTATCDGPRLFVPEAGDELTCTASDEAGRPLELVVRLLDAEGAYEVRPRA